MFIIKAEFSEKFTIDAPLEKVRAFYTDMKNYVELMNGVESIRENGKGVMNWTIRAEIPVVGSIRQVFPVRQSEDDENLLEWLPQEGETQNFLRFTADLVSKTDTQTLVQVSQKVELRRKSGTELHALAPLAGEAAISRAMQRKVGEMIAQFLEKSKAELER